MDPIWLNRTSVDRLIEGIDFKVLKYDPDTGQYCLSGEPFTRITKSRHKDGSLQGLSLGRGSEAGNGGNEPCRCRTSKAATR